MVVTVVMTTYMPLDDVGHARARYAWETLKSLGQNLVASEGLKLHIADDGSPEVRRTQINAMCTQAFDYWHTEATRSDSERHGIGASLNLALQDVQDYWMYITDDWLLTDLLCLDLPIKLLSSLDYDLVRLGPIHPDLTCLTRFSQNTGWWLDIQQHYGGFAFATRPFIATKNFYEKIGPFDEDTNVYEAERLYAERVAKSTAKLAYWGGVDLAGPWSHIGEENIGYKNL